MALLAEINRQKLKLYDQEFNKLNNKYIQLLDDHTNALTIIDDLKKEIEILEKENQKYKIKFSLNNENGYIYELDQIEKS